METNRIIYNEAQKQKYMDAEPQNAAGLKNYFLRVGRFEEALGKDLADLNAGELGELVLSLRIRSEIAKSHLISMLRAYVKWVHSQGLNKIPNQKAIEELSADDVSSKEAIKAQMIKSPKQLNLVLSTIHDNGYYNYEIKEAKENLIFWLLYNGLEVEQLRVLKKKDIDIVRKTIFAAIFNEKGNIVGKKEIQIDDKIIKWWQTFAKASQIERPGERLEKGCSLHDLTNSEYLFRPVMATGKEKCLTLISFRATINRLFDKYTKETGIPLRVSPYNIKLSGIFYNALADEKNKIQITKEYMAEKLGLKCKDSRELVMKTRRFLYDYKNWKEAFGY